MNREIKFEYILEQDGKIKKAQYTLEDLAGGALLDDFSALTWNRKAIRQFTGLKDKNGVEIYEGDIVKVKFNSQQIANGEITFDRGCFMWYQIPEKYGTELIGLVHEAEVIGNVFQNPELLKDNQ